eukprot:gene15765-20881_t
MARFGFRPGVVISDSFGRPWRMGTVNVAIGVAAMPAIIDQRGQPDRDGRIMQMTMIAVGDAVAAAAGLAMGEGDEGIPAVIVRGLVPMSGRYAVLTGGVGGAKLVDGLYRLLPANSLTAIVNTGDDFCHFGLPISPDIDTLLYTLSEKSNQALGWGREGETWSFMEAVRSLGGEGWFNLGDGDLALHVMRRMALDAGEALSLVTARFVAAWGLALRVVPMSDDAVATWVERKGTPHRFQPTLPRDRGS